MKILRHRLHRDDGTPVTFKESPNRGGKLDHQYLVMHYTAGSTASGAISTLTNPAAKVSAHLVIARTGTITQLVPFDRIAFHAGRSRWHGLQGLNKFSIGIELDNAGVLERQGNKWRAWFGKLYDNKDVLEATHQHETVPRGWHTYTPAQLEATIKVSQVLANRYGLRDVVGHDDIAPGRKLDPGPAFPLASVRASVVGRRDDDPDLFETAAHLNVREGPGTQFDKLAISPLGPGRRLRMRSREASWCFVDVLGGADEATDTGWVHGDFIQPVD